MKNKWRLLAILIPIIIVALALVLGLEFPAILELKVIDLVLRSSAPANTAVPIAIVSVDEKSLNQIGEVALVTGYYRAAHRYDRFGITESHRCRYHVPRTDARYPGFGKRESQAIHGLLFQQHRSPD